MLKIAYYYCFAILKYNSEGACPQTPLEKVCTVETVSYVLYSNLLAISIFIETLAYTAVYKKDEGNLFKTMQYKPCDHKGGTYIKVGSNRTLIKTPFFTKMVQLSWTLYTYLRTLHPFSKPLLGLKFINDFTRQHNKTIDCRCSKYFN